MECLGTSFQELWGQHCEVFFAGARLPLMLFINFIYGIYIFVMKLVKCVLNCFLYDLGFDDQCPGLLDYTIGNYFEVVFKNLRVLQEMTFHVYLRRFLSQSLQFFLANLKRHTLFLSEKSLRKFYLFCPNFRPVHSYPECN